MFRLSRIAAIVAFIFVLALSASGQLRGRGRLQGVVTDKATGKPVVGATITIAPAKESTTPIVTKTDAKGRWSAIGFTNGVWNIDIVANGYETQRGTANVSEVQMLPPIHTEMTAEVKQEAPVEAPIAPSVPKEAVDAIKEAQDLLAVKGTADEMKANATRAAADFERALPLVPDKPEFAQTRLQIEQVMAQAYYKAGDVAKAVSNLEQVRAADPTNTGVQLLLVNLYLENSQLDKAKALLTTLPANAITEPTPYINLGILFLNKKDPESAVTYLDKAVALDPKTMESYYYRGLAEVQLKRNKEAKADFQQVLALAPPDSSEAHDAKQLLAGIK